MKRVLLICFLFPLTFLWAEDMSLGVHAGLGTDLNLGLGIGAKVSIIPSMYRGHPLELGAELFYSHSVEVSDNGFNEYEETTNLVVFALMGNWLINYVPEQIGFYYIVGIGVAGISVDWRETSETDSSLGEPYGTSGSQQSAEGVTGGTILNLGAAYNLGDGFEIRLELPFLVIFTAPGQASAVAPALTLMGGYRF